MSHTRGVLLIVCGPSGVGKTTMCHRLLERHEPLRFSISYTTRPPRGDEEEGVDYHFVDDEEFDRMREAGEFAEWADVHGHRYGTARSTIESAWEHGADLLFDIDYQGARQLKSTYDHAEAVFVIPPSMEELRERLSGRGTESSESFQRRLDQATQELRQYELFDYLVTNDALAEAVDVLDAIYEAARRARPLQASRVRRLLEEAEAGE